LTYFVAWAAIVTKSAEWISTMFFRISVFIRARLTADEQALAGLGRI
jgi:hypothetical protein